jgi:hypothetical protein
VAKASPGKTSFNAGELSPRLEGRVDIDKYANGCRKLENFIPLVQGGALKRSGFRHIANAYFDNKASRLIPFEFGTEQAYILEFADSIIRVFKDNGTVTSDSLAISGASQTNPVVVSVVGHGITRPTTVTITGVGGMTQLNNRQFTTGDAYGDDVAVTGATQTDPVVLSATAHGFELGDEVFVEGVGGMTEINDRTFTVGEAAGSGVTITLIENSSPAQVKTLTDHGFSEGDRVFITGVVGMTEVNDLWFTVGDTSNKSFDIYDADGVEIDAGDYTEYDSGGTVAPESDDHLSLVGEDGTGHTAYSSPGTVKLTSNPDKVNLTGEDGTGHDAYTTGGAMTGSVVSIVSPYRSTELDEIQTAQSADVLYIVHPDYAPRKLERTSHVDWTLTEIDFDWMAFGPQNVDKTVEVRSNAATGGATIDTDDSIFESGHVGRFILIREAPSTYMPEWAPASDLSDYDGSVAALNSYAFWEENVYELTNKNAKSSCGTSPPIHDEYGETQIDGKWSWTFRYPSQGYAEITGFTDANNVSATVIHHLPTSCVGAVSANLVYKWAWSAWGPDQGYPRAVAFFEDRLWLGGTDSFPQTVWASRVGEYENFQVTSEVDSGMTYTLASGPMDVIEWLSTRQEVVIGTAGGEFVMRSADPSQALTVETIDAKLHSTYGSKAAVAPVRVGNVVMFVQRSGRTLLQFIFDEDVNSFDAVDMNALATDIAIDGIKAMAYQQEPNRILWAITETGELLGFTYQRQHQVAAWHKHPIGGTDVVVESIAVIPHPDGDQDQLWAVVSRTIDGGTKRSIETLQPDWLSTDDLEDAFFVDSGLTYRGAAVGSVTGLSHLEGETVQVLGDGLVQTDKTVSSGSITLDTNASVVHVGLAYEAVVQGMRVEAGASDGTAQGKTKRFNRVVFRLDQTGGEIQYGPTDTDADMDTLPLTAGELFDGDTESLSWPGGYEQEGRVTVKHTKPLPCTVTAWFPQGKTEDRS